MGQFAVSPYAMVARFDIEIFSECADCGLGPKLDNIIVSRGPIH